MPPHSDLTIIISALNWSGSEADLDPPESFSIPKEHELDWLDRNAVIERKGSTKASALNLSTPNRNFGSSLSSDPSPSIIGLPKSYRSCFAATGKFRRPGKARLFRSRSEPGGKLVQVAEPGSPRVSCMGRVGSKRGGGKRTGLWAGLKAVLRGNRWGGRTGVGEPGGRRVESGTRSESWGGNAAKRLASVHVEKSKWCKLE